MEIETSQEIRPIKVKFGSEEHTYEFKHAIVHGVENKEDGKLMSLICGYTDLNDFVMVYANILVECYNFLKENYVDEKDFDVLKTLKDYTENIFDGIEKGDFEDSERETTREEI